MAHEKWFSGEFVARASLAAVTGLGLVATTGCTFTERHSTTHAIPTPSPTPIVTAEPTPDCALALEQFSVDRGAKSGGAYAINEGECVNVFGPELDDTTGAVGRIPEGETFYIECYDLTASALRVNVQGAKGLLDLGPVAMQQLDEDPSARSIRTC